VALTFAEPVKARRASEEKEDLAGASGLDLFRNLIRWRGACIASGSTNRTGQGK
jgi:hypothetical protein